MAYSIRKLMEKGKLNEKGLRAILKDHEERITALENGSETPTPTPTPTPETRNISFSVKSGDVGVENAVVTLDGDETITGTTGSAGGCTISNVEDGTHSVSVVATGYTTYTGSITVSSSNTSFDISLTLSG